MSPECILFLEEYLISHNISKQRQRLGNSCVQNNIRDISIMYYGYYSNEAN